MEKTIEHNVKVRKKAIEVFSLIEEYAEDENLSKDSHFWNCISEFASAKNLVEAVKTETKSFYSSIAEQFSTSYDTFDEETEDVIVPSGERYGGMRIEDCPIGFHRWLSLQPWIENDPKWVFVAKWLRNEGFLES